MPEHTPPAPASYDSPESFQVHLEKSRLISRTGTVYDPRAVPHLFAGDSHLMVRGSFDAEGEAFMILRSARC